MSLIECKNVGSPMTLTWKINVNSDKCGFLPEKNNTKYEQRNDDFCCLTFNQFSCET